MTTPREKQASDYYETAMLRVKNTSYPTGQKFPPGTRVRINEVLPRSMSHFASGVLATVEYTYAHAYGGSDVKSYSLNIDGKGSVAWYPEYVLELEDKETRMMSNKKKMMLYVYLATQLGLNPVLVQPMGSPDMVVVSGKLFDPINDPYYFKKVLYWATQNFIQFDLHMIYAEAFNCSDNHADAKCHTSEFPPIEEEAEEKFTDRAYLGLFEAIAYAHGWTYKETT